MWILEEKLEKFAVCYQIYSNYTTTALIRKLLKGFFIIMVQQSPLDQGLLIIDHSWSHSNTLQSVGLLWTSDQPDAGISTWQHTTLTTDTHVIGWIRTRNPSKRAAADPRLGPRGRWVRFLKGGDFKIGQVICPVKYADDFVLLTKQETVVIGLTGWLTVVTSCIGTAF